MIRLENISKKYGEKTVLENFSYVFPDGGFFVIKGKSGIGKTTLLNIISGLDFPDSGQVTFSKSNTDFSVVFQEDRLLEYETVLNNVLLVMNEKNPGIKDKAIELLEKLGLAEELNELASKLSGGMKRRTAIARCLAVDADVYIMDEPIKGLDAELHKKILGIIHENTDKRGKLLIMVTHNMDETLGSDAVIDLESTSPF